MTTGIDLLNALGELSQEELQRPVFVWVDGERYPISPYVDDSVEGILEININ